MEKPDIKTPATKRKRATAVTLLCATLMAICPPAAALANQSGLLEMLSTKNITAIAEGTLSSNENIRWALGTGGNLSVTGAGAIEADDALYEICDQVEHVFVGKNITDIGPETFSYFSQLKSVEFEDSSKLENVGAYAFAGCGNLEYIDLPGSVKEIGSSAFLDCFNLSWASFGDVSSLAKIGGSAFSNCSSLDRIGLPSGLEEIGDYAFSGCNLLSSITIPAKVKTVGEGAFENCPKLENVHVENPAGTRIDGYAFAGNTKASPKTIVIKKEKMTKRSLKISWKKVDGAKSYKLYYRQTSSKHYKSASTKKTQKTLRKLKKGKRYQYYLAAKSGGKVICKSVVRTSMKIK